MPNLTRARRITSGSVEWVSAWLDSAADGGAGVTLSAQAVAIAVQPVRVRPNGDTTWRTAAWAGTAGVARAARILIGPATSNVIPLGEYDIWTKLTDNPEIPEVYHGRLSIY
jgi:hypothetical protein